MRTKIRCNRLVRIGAALLLPVMLAACSNGKASNPRSAGAAKDLAVNHVASAHMPGGIRAGLYYKTLDEALPNVTYQFPTGERRTMSNLVVVGEIVDVAKGKAWTKGEDEGGEETADFDTPNAKWRSMVATVRVSEVIGGQEEVGEVRVTMRGPRPEQFASVAKGLREFGQVVMFLLRDTALATHDRSLYAVLEDGGMWATVDPDGTLHLPFVEPERAPGLLATTPRLDDLRRLAAVPRIIPMVGHPLVAKRA